MKKTRRYLVYLAHRAFLLFAVLVVWALAKIKRAIDPHAIEFRDNLKKAVAHAVWALLVLLVAVQVGGRVVASSVHSMNREARQVFVQEVEAAMQFVSASDSWSEHRQELARLRQMIRDLRKSM